MSHEVWFLMGAVAGGLGGYVLALTINYWEYWRTHRAPIELDEQLEAFQRLQERYPYCHKVEITTEMQDETWRGWPLG